MLVEKKKRVNVGYESQNDVLSGQFSHSYCD